MRVSHDGALVRLGGVKQLAVLAALLLERGRFVSRERLIDLVWGDDPPSGGVNTLQVHISQLRKALAPGGIQIRSSPAGYAIDVAEAELDLLEFERLASLGREALADHDFTAAARSLAEALALWEGVALAELWDIPFANAEAARLERHRLAALEDRLQAQLGLGMHREVVAELETLVRDHPLREPLRGLLMLALYRCGRQADALDVYRAGRELLVASQGVDPGGELRGLHQAILNQAPSLTLPAGPSEPDVRASVIPAPLTPLVGRDGDVERLVARVRDRDVRLLVLTGPGGVGKTRLALEVASAVEREFTDGVGLVDMSALQDPTLVTAAIAARLDVSPIVGQDTHWSLAAALRRRTMLLVIDNFEHLVAGAPAIAALLEEAPGVKVLATSRSPLGVVGEHDEPIEPLVVPPVDVASLDEVRLYPAAEVFLTRARAVDPTLALNDADAPVVASVCRRLDGLPLALELAASALRLLALGELDATLESGLDVGLTLNRARPERHRTMRATIDWSYHLLDRDAALLLPRLGVFAGGFTRGAAARVCDFPDLDAALAALVEARLVKRVERFGASRFHLLETIRQYALELFGADPLHDRVMELHALWAVDIAEGFDLETRDGTLERRMAETLDELDNVRAACCTLTDLGRGVDLLRLIVAVAPLGMRVHGDEQRRWLVTGLELAADAAPPTLRAQAYHFVGGEALQRDDLRDGAEAYTAALRLAELAGDLHVTAWSNVALGWIAQMRGDSDGAVLFLDRGMVAAEGCSATQRAGIYRNAVLVFMDQFDLDRAWELATESLRIADESGDRETRAWALSRMGTVEMLRVRFDPALRLIRECGARRGVGPAYAGR